MSKYKFISQLVTFYLHCDVCIFVALTARAFQSTDLNLQWRQSSI